MNAPACPRCGYAAPPAQPCPTCGEAASKNAPGPCVRGWAGVPLALVALPRGLALLAGTPGTKRWLLPPFLLTSGLVVALFLWARRAIGRLAERARPDDLQLPEWAWVESLPESWSWVRSTYSALSGALEWLAGALVSFLLAQPFQLLTTFLVGSLVVWYGASIVYEALAGPFLDEVQARVEARWYGADPRAALERPEGLGSDAALRLLSLGVAAGVGGALVLGLALGLPAWIWGLAFPVGLSLPLALDPGYGRWLAWFTRVELRALLAGLQGAAISLGILLLALPLYLVPVVGYFLYAAATGVATATSLLDIPLERRGWPFRARLRLLVRHAPTWIAFGVLSGLLLAVPLVGPLLFVPTTSLGGLWLLCRLDKSGLTEASVASGRAPA